MCVPSIRNCTRFKAQMVRLPAPCGFHFERVRRRFDNKVNLDESHSPCSYIVVVLYNHWPMSQGWTTLAYLSTIPSNML